MVPDVTERMDAVRGLDLAVQMVGAVIAHFGDNRLEPFSVFDVIHALTDLIRQLSEAGGRLRSGGLCIRLPRQGQEERSGNTECWQFHIVILRSVLSRSAALGLQGVRGLECSGSFSSAAGGRKVLLASREYHTWDGAMTASYIRQS